MGSKSVPAQHHCGLHSTTQWGDWHHQQFSCSVLYQSRGQHSIGLGLEQGATFCSCILLLLETPIQAVQ